MFWEAGTNNGNRHLCHRIFRADALSDGASHDAMDDATDNVTDDHSTDHSSDLECICYPALIMPCIAGRSHQKFKDVKDTFFTHFDAIRFEKEPRSGAYQNKLGSCPICDKELIQRSKLGPLSDYVMITEAHEAGTRCRCGIGYGCLKCMCIVYDLDIDDHAEV